MIEKTILGGRSGKFGWMKKSGDNSINSMETQTGSRGGSHDDDDDGDDDGRDLSIETLNRDNKNRMDEKKNKMGRKSKKNNNNNSNNINDDEITTAATMTTTATATATSRRKSDPRFKKTSTLGRIWRQGAASVLSAGGRGARFRKTGAHSDAVDKKDERPDFAEVVTSQMRCMTIEIR